MSENWFRLIPTDPSYVPGESQRARAKRALRAILPGADAIEADVFDQVEFVDPGPSNFESVECPVCKAPLPMAWWQEAMDRAYKDHFIDLTITTPCCSAVSNLNDLEYEWPAGFARFVLEARSPGVPNLDPSDIADLEPVLGCSLRLVRAHH